MTSRHPHFCLAPASRAEAPLAELWFLLGLFAGCHGDSRRGSPWMEPIEARSNSVESCAASRLWRSNLSWRSEIWHRSAYARPPQGSGNRAVVLPAAASPTPDDTEGDRCCEEQSRYDCRQAEQDCPDATHCLGHCDLPSAWLMLLPIVLPAAASPTPDDTERDRYCEEQSRYGCRQAENDCPNATQFLAHSDLPSSWLMLLPIRSEVCSYHTLAL